MNRAHRLAASASTGLALLAATACGTTDVDKAARRQHRRRGTRVEELRRRHHGHLHEAGLLHGRRRLYR